MSHLLTLTQATGIGAVLIDFPATTINPEGTARRHYGAESWKDTLIDAVKLRETSGQDEIRVVLGDDTLLVLRERGHVIAVVFPTGNAISKSVHRMMRKACKEPGRVRSPRQVAAPTPTTVGGTATDGDYTFTPTPTPPAPTPAPGPITAADAFGG